MYRTRVVAKMPSRRKSKRPTSLPITITNAWGMTVEKEILTADNLALLHLPILPPPGIMTGNLQHDEIPLIGLETIYTGKPIKEFLSIQKSTGVIIKERIDLSSFFRMLAKIAYCYMVANDRTPPPDETPLLDLVKGKRFDYAN